MRVLFAPAKRMRTDNDVISHQTLPVFLNDAERLRDWLRGLSREELRKLWQCNDAILKQNIERLSCMDLRSNLTPAILAYEGIAYQYMAPGVFEDNAFIWVQNHLRILSGFYGVLRPMDGVTPHRLEMRAKVTLQGKNLYAFWNRKLYEEILDESGVFLNLASTEYSQCVETWHMPKDRFITCVFGELCQGKVIQKGVHVKMARGRMVRLMAEHDVREPEEIQNFDVLGYRYDIEHSNRQTYVFLKSEEKDSPFTGEDSQIPCP